MLSDKIKIAAFVSLVLAFAAYTFYLYTHLPVGQQKTSDPVIRGKTAWQKYNCSACHQIYGLGGFLGPDLTNVYSLRGKDYIRAFMITGTTIMPQFHLSEQEMNDVTAFLYGVDSSGNADPRSIKKYYDGTIEQ